MTNFGHDVCEKRFSAHGTGKKFGFTPDPKIPLLSPENLRPETKQRPENISYWNKSKKAPAENRKCLFFVAGRRIELRTS